MLKTVSCSQRVSVPAPGAENRVFQKLRREQYARIQKELGIVFFAMQCRFFLTSS
jgi:hypothetical protein